MGMQIANRPNRIKRKVHDLKSGSSSKVCCEKKQKSQVAEIRLENVRITDLLAPELLFATVPLLSASPPSRPSTDIATSLNLDDNNGHDILNSTPEFTRLNCNSAFEEAAPTSG